MSVLVLWLRPQLPYSAASSPDPFANHEHRHRDDRPKDRIDDPLADQSQRSIRSSRRRDHQRDRRDEGQGHGVVSYHYDLDRELEQREKRDEPEAVRLGHFDETEDGHATDSAHDAVYGAAGIGP